MGINRKKAFALLISVIFASVMLALGTALASLGYKQQILASGAARSQYAFYAADAALECALLDAQKVPVGDPFSYQNYPYVSGKPTPSCNGIGVTGTGSVMSFTELCYNANNSQCVAGQRVTSKRFEIAFGKNIGAGATNPGDQATGSGYLCADITVYEQQNKPAGSTYVFSQGYDVPCNKVDTTDRIVARGIYATF